MLINPNYPNLAYDLDTESFYRISPVDNKAIRRILPDESYFIYANNPQGRLTRKKAHIFCWIIANGEIPEGYYVIQVQDTLKLSNLRLVNTQEYTQYKDAEYNLKNITIAKERRAYTYTLKYMQDGKLASVKKLVYDDALKLKSHLAGVARDCLDKFKEKV